MISKMRLKEWWLRFFRKVKKLIFFILLISIFLIILLVMRQFFTVQKIEVKGTSNLKGVEVMKDQLIFLIDEKKSEKALYYQNPQINSIKITRSYPNKIIINVTAGYAIAVLETEGAFFEMSSLGRIIKKEKKSPARLPKIKHYQKFSYYAYNVGEVIDIKDIQYGLFFIDHFHDLGINVQGVDIRGDDMLILNSEGRNFFFTTKRSSEDQFDDLKIIIKRFSVEGVKFESIDLRFDKPIIKLK